MKLDTSVHWICQCQRSTSKKLPLRKINLGELQIKKRCDQVGLSYNSFFFHGGTSKFAAFPLYIAFVSKKVPTFYCHYMNRSRSRPQINFLNRWVRGEALLAEPTKLLLLKHSRVVVSQRRSLSEVLLSSERPVVNTAARNYGFWKR